MVCKAKGNLGNWFAKVSAPRHPEINGLELPCIWDFWADGRHYCDKGFDGSATKFKQLVEGLKSTGHAVMRKRDMKLGHDVWKHESYIAVFKIKNVEAGDELTFDFVERICDLK